MRDKIGMGVSFMGGTFVWRVNQTRLNRISYLKTLTFVPSAVNKDGKKNRVSLTSAPADSERSGGLFQIQY